MHYLFLRKGLKFEKLIEFKAQLKFRYQVRPLGFISVIATTVGLLDIALPIMHFAAYVGNVSWIDKLAD